MSRRSNRGGQSRNAKQAPPSRPAAPGAKAPPPAPASAAKAPPPAARPGPRSAAPRRRRNNTNLIIAAVAGVVLVAAIGLGIARQLSRNVGEQVPDQGVGLHIQNPDDPLPVAWNSNPPTSGYHWVGTAPWGVSTEPIPDTMTLHNIEHGGINIFYRQGLDQAQVDQLTAQARDLIAENPCVILAPRPADQMDAPVILTAWTYILRLDSPDQGAIRQFFDAHIGRGPERQCLP